MDHAEAHELLSDLALEPSRLAALAGDTTSETAPLRAHIEACATCAGEVEAWRRTWSAFGDVRASATSATSATSDGDVLRMPARAKTRTLRAVAAPLATPAGALIARTADRPRRLPWLLAAAALVVAIGAGSLAWVRTTELEQARAEAVDLSAVAATMDRVLADPVHWVTPLTTADGAPGGTLVWSNTEIVVISAALPVPEPGQVYRCWVERGGKRTPVGAMEFTHGTGYWAGSMAGWADLLKPGARFGVSLVPASGGGGAPMLIGSI